MGAIVSWVVVIVIVLVAASAIIHSVMKTIQRTQGRDRCVSCKSRLKAANGKYATTCRKCGAKQPWADKPEVDPLTKAKKRSRIVLGDGEKVERFGKVRIDRTRGMLFLTNRRLHFTPRRRNGQVVEVDLADVQTVVQLTDVGGFGVNMSDGQRYRFRTPGPGDVWHAETLAAANTVGVKHLRRQRSRVSNSASGPSDANGSVTTIPAPPALGPPAGWYPEPSAPSGLRWWDGRAWGPAAPSTANRPGS